MVALLVKFLNPQVGLTNPITLSATIIEDKFGMSSSEIFMTLQFCGLNSGNESYLLEYLEVIHKKNISDSRKEQIVLSQLPATE